MPAGSARHGAVRAQRPYLAPLRTINSGKPRPFRGGKARSDRSELAASQTPKHRPATRPVLPPDSPGPASRRGPTGPTLRANPCSEVTDPDCRFPLPTLVYRLEAPNLGDLMRRWVQSVSKQGLRYAAVHETPSRLPRRKEPGTQEPASRPGHRPV